MRHRAFAFVGALMTLMPLCPGASAARRAPETLLSGETMGSVWTVKIAGPLPRAPAVLRTQIQARFEAVESEMSTYRTDSALSRFNRHPDGDWQALPAALYTVLEFALSLAADTQGAYDVTAGPLVNLWGFGPGKFAPGVPSDAEIATARALVDWRRVELEPTQRRARRPPGTYVDLSSLAKGYGVDEVARFLDREKVDRYLIDLSGKLRARGANGRGEPWAVAVETPGPDRPDGNPAMLGARVALHSESIATAGNYRRRFAADGKDYSHLIDTTTGRPIDGDVASVTVVAADCMTADAWATALILMPWKRAQELAEVRGLSAYFAMTAGPVTGHWASGAWIRQAWSSTSVDRIGTPGPPESAPRARLRGSGPSPALSR